MADVIAGRFALCDPIARGGSGVVWRAYDRKTGTFCAAKVLRRRDAGDLLRFVREQSVRLDHPHVLTPYSWAAEDAYVVIASELVDGGSLSTLITEHGALSEFTVAVLLDQLLAGLEAVHGAGLVHRDVKPANVLLQATGTGAVRSQLSDFGLAMGAEDARLTQLGTVVGTPGYVAPEIMLGEAPNVRQDLYAAGRVAAAMLLGREPSGSSGEPDLRHLHSAALRSLVETLSNANPARRPRSAQEARGWLHRQVSGDARPRTRAGAPIDVRHQLDAPPDPESLRDLSAMPMAMAATGAAATRGGDTPSASTARSAPVRRARRRLAAAGVAAAVLAVAVPVTVVVLNRDTTASDTTDRISGPLRVVPSGGSCDWTQQNDRARTSGGQLVTCTISSTGYAWSG